MSSDEPDPSTCIRYAPGVRESLMDLALSLSDVPSIRENIMGRKWRRCDPHSFYTEIDDYIRYSCYVRNRNEEKDNPAIIEMSDVMCQFRVLLFEIVDHALFDQHHPTRRLDAENNYCLSVLARIGCTNIAIAQRMTDAICESEHPPSILPWNDIDLVGDPQSPLTLEELQSIYRYIGSIHGRPPRRCHVRLILHCIYELGRVYDIYEFDDAPRSLTPQAIIDITHSVWFTILQDRVL